jgi:hypothetical protein
MGCGGGGELRSDDETLSCSSSSAVTSALVKRSYRRITGSAEGAASVANGRGGGAGRRTERNTKEKRAGRFGGPEPPDPLEDFKILFFRRMEEPWRELMPGGTTPTATDAAAAA